MKEKKNQSKKVKFAYLVKSVPEEFKKKVISYRDKKISKTPVDIEYIDKKTFKQMEEVANEHNSNLQENEKPVIYKLAGYSSLKKPKDKSDAILKVVQVVDEKTDNTEKTEVAEDEEKKLDDVNQLDEDNKSGETVEDQTDDKKENVYLFGVNTKKPFYKGVKGYVFTDISDTFVAVTRNYIIPILLVLLTILGVGGYGISHIMITNPDNEFENFDPEIDEGINQTQKPNKNQEVNQGIKVEGFSKWTIKAGVTEDVVVPLRNPAGNPCYFTFEIKLKDNNEVLYKSKMVPPGKGIGNITLSRPFSAGNYDVVIMIYTNELETGSKMNSAQLDVELTVVEE